MAFKRERAAPQGKILPVSLIDVVFLLLVFFLVTNLISQIGRTEQKFYVRTPENTPGQASVCLQIVNGNEYLWLDSEVGEEIHQRLKREYGDLLDRVPKKKMTELVMRELRGISRLNWEQLRWKIDEFKRKAERRNQMRQEVIEEHYFLIRCPDDHPYHRLLDLLRVLKSAEEGGEVEYISYGTTGGDVDDIFQASQATFEWVTTRAGMMRQVLKISF